MSPALGLGNDPAAQAAVFVGGMALGFCVGAFYDLLRLFRLGKGSRVWAAVLDTLFWCAVCGSLLLYTVCATGGEVQLYALVAIFLGGVAYFLLLSPLVRKIEGFLLWLWGKIWAFITLPVRLLGRGAKNFWIFFKKLFPFAKIWFTITDTLGAVSRGPSRKRSREGGRG